MWRRLGRHGLCRGCVDFRTSGGFAGVRNWFSAKVYCSGCRAEHDAIYFSAEQRVTRERVCIGREGRLLLCDHTWMNWYVLRPDWLVDPLWLGVRGAPGQRDSGLLMDSFETRLTRDHD